MERVVLTENLDRNQILGQAFAKTVQRPYGFFLNSTTVSPDCLNRNILMGPEQLKTMYEICRDMYQSPVVTLLGPSAGVENQARTLARLSYLLDVVRHTPVAAQVWVILVSPNP